MPSTAPEARPDGFIRSGDEPLVGPLREPLEATDARPRRQVPMSGVHFTASRWTRLLAPVIIGIDDWAWRRNHCYGTLICDLERRKTIALLPDREPATAEAWLIGQPLEEALSC